ncbi:unnamed protein product [Brassicogethes aeneus]|uniref:Uncharacterized protein n=1 Tax=Brassicogethes aeneus TaxID=1431903 RepID=A0A9P0BCQ4_BRAAE|nr:unnamed protein product [Brassicogethes aeneus]
MEEDTLSNSEICSFIADMSDSEDPTYTPEMERKEEKKRSIPDFFSVTSASSSKVSECSDKKQKKENKPENKRRLQTYGRQSAEAFLDSHVIGLMKIINDVALLCQRFMGSHTFEKIAEILDNIHAKFGLHTEKLVATVTDNGSNFVKAFKEFGGGTLTKITDTESDNGEGEEDYYEFTSILNDFFSLQLPKHVRCASHTLNLIATTDVKNAIQSDPIL